MEHTSLDPSTTKVEAKYIKILGSDEPKTTILRNVNRIDKGILAYVQRRMGRSEVTGEVIGEAINFEEEMDRELRKAETEVTE